MYIDTPLSLWLHAHPHPILIHLMLLVTYWHSTIGIAVMTVVLALVLRRMGRSWWLLSLLLCVPGGMLVNVAVKHLVHRARPHFDDPLLTLSSYSFPSGHTAGATLFYGFLAAFLLAHVHAVRWRKAIVAGAVTMVLLVGFSRMYLGVHYLSDVVAGMLEGVLWVALSLGSVHALRRRREQRVA